MISDHQHNTMTIVARDRSFIATHQTLSYGIPFAHSFATSIHRLLSTLPATCAGTPSRVFLQTLSSRENCFPIRPIGCAKVISSFVELDVPARWKQPPKLTKRKHRKIREKDGSGIGPKTKRSPLRFFLRQATPRSQQTTTLPSTASLTSTLVDVPRRISRDVIRGGHGITAKG